MAALEAGITPLVRVPGVAEVSRVLDGGALGIIAPHVRSAAEARDYVRAAKFPPLGDRSAAGPLPHLHYRSFPAARGRCRAQRRHLADGAVRERGGRGERRRDRRGRRRRHGDDRLERSVWPIGACPANTTMRGCARLMPKPSPPAASTASMSASAGCRRGPSLPPNSCAWARAMSRPAPISAFCWRRVRPKRRKCGR